MHNPLRGSLSGRLIRIFSNTSLFNQSEVNFAENMFYNEFALGDKCPTSRTLGAPILEEEE